MAGVETAADRASFYDTEDHAVTVSWRNSAGQWASFNAIFDREFVAVDPDTGVTVESDKPRLSAEAAGLPALKQGDRVEIEAEDGTLEAFEVVGRQPDGTGMIVIELTPKETPA